MKTIYPWQQTQWQQILQRFNHQALPHALLLSGEVGMGKLDFAITLAQWLLCPARTDKACGDCSVCQLIIAQTHSDLILVQPEAAGKLIKIEQIRQLTDTLNKTAQQGGYQIAIVEPAEMMNAAAANALLKTLEEPANRVLLILVSHRPAALPATIRSRCQKIHFQLENKKLALQWLAEHTPNPHDLTTALALAENSPLLALQLLDVNSGVQKQEWAHLLIAIMLQQQDPVQAAAKLNQIEMAAFLTTLQQLLLELLRMKHGLAPVYFTETKLANHLTKLSLQTEFARLFKLIDNVATVKNWLGQHINLNQQLLLENLFLQLR